MLRLNRLSVVPACILASVWATAASGQVLNEDRKIFTLDGSGNDQIGNAVAIADGVIGMGASGEDEMGSNSGAVYLFDALTGVQLMKLHADDAAIGDNLGLSIAMDQGIVVAGATGDDDNGSRSGSVYIFDVATGMQLRKLVPADGAENDKFGDSVAISGNLVAVGASLDDDNGSNSGSAYLFNATTGDQLFKLLPDDGDANDAFGAAIAIADGIIAVGAPLDDDASQGATGGSVYLFDAITGNQIAKLIGGDAFSGDQFGDSVAISDGVVVVGSPAHDDNGINSGSAYLFAASSGFQLFEIKPLDGEQSDLFGRSVAISGGVVIVGALGDDDLGSASGSAYLFNADDGTQISKLLASDGSGSDVFGQSVGIDGGLAVVGAKLGDGVSTDSGAGYVFELGAGVCPADLTGDGDLNFLDVSAFLAAFGNQDPIADFQADGDFNFLDVSAFLAAFGAGCP